MNAVEQGAFNRASVVLAAGSFAVAVGAVVVAWSSSRSAAEATDAAEQANRIAEEAVERADSANGIAERANAIAESANSLAEDANTFAERAEQRQDRQEQLQFAQNVSLTEAPRWMYQASDWNAGEIYWAVINYNTTQIGDVWVEGDDGKSVHIWDIPPCSIYGLPVRSEFDPVAVYFSDPFGSWRRDRSNSTPEFGSFPPPEGDDTHDASLDLTIPDCP